ncbi:PHB depolymerase family esterase [Halobacteriovorax sp.]|uniref:extracellular catalytic domain type 1 short-chain-length polyhydroxyalkanoate depolymerase n=1 Tax=Halobacteriovorax sp. TaxID=2020862 RepID=UPI0035672C33
MAQTVSHKIQTAYGTREYKFYSPSSAYNNSPTVVAIHGCKQTGDVFARGSRLYQAASKYGFNLLLPEQDKNTNPYNCWNWFLPHNQIRMGEASIVVKSIQDAQKKYRLNKDKYFVLGMSSGAAMANILMNCYPKMFKAVASHSGVPYSATSNPLLATHVLENGMLTTPQLTALKGLACGLYAQTSVPALIIQGAKDEVVAPINAEDLAQQYKIYNSYSYEDLKVSTRSVERTDGHNYQVNSWRDRSDKVIVEEVMIENLKHKWSGGDDSLDYNQSKGPNATKMIINFFKANGL